MTRIAVLDAFEVFFTQTVDNLVQYLDGEVPARTLNPEAVSRRAV